MIAAGQLDGGAQRPRHRLRGTVRDLDLPQLAAWSLITHLSSTALVVARARDEQTWVSEATCQNCGHPATMHAMTGKRYELCVMCPGVHAPAPAAHRPGYLWKIAEDTCRGCGAYIGDTPRFLHVGVCKDCAPALKH